MRQHFLIQTTWLAALCGAALADTVEQTRLFLIQPGSVTGVGMAAVSNGLVGDTAERTFSGGFQAIFSFDRNSLEVENFRFNGGEILTTGYRLEFTGNIVYGAPFGQRFTYILREPGSLPSSMRFSPETRADVTGDVLPDGTLNNTDYYLFADQGSQVTGRSVAGSAQPPVLINYSVSPANVLFKGVATPSIAEISSTLFERSVQAYLTIEYDEADVSTLPGSVTALDLEVLETESGTVTCRTNPFVIPTGYGSWTDDNDLEFPIPEETNAAGLAYAILFALDLPVSASSLPIRVEHSVIGPVARIVLPEGGLQNPMSIEYSSELDNPDWLELPPANYVDGADSLDLGATGEPAFTFPDGERGFIRFVSIVE